MTIDLAAELGAPTYRASGFIYGFSQDGTQPAPSTQSDIKTQFIRAGLAVPGEDDDWTAYTDFMTQVIEDAIADGIFGTSQICMSSVTAQCQYLEMWKRGYEMLRAAIPEVVIVGPSSAGQPLLGWFTTYLDYVNEH